MKDVRVLKTGNDFRAAFKQIGHRTGTITSSVMELIEVIGCKPKYYFDDDFPNDEDKCSVTWGLERVNAKGERVYCVIYDYKYWNYKGIEIDVMEEINFSVCCIQPELFPELKIKSI